MLTLKLVIYKKKLVYTLLEVLKKALLHYQKMKAFLNFVKY